MFQPEQNSPYYAQFYFFTPIMNNWIPTYSLNIPVMTKIEDGAGIRNEQVLIRQGNLWFTSDMGMYVYYVPTHWQEIE